MCSLCSERHLASPKLTPHRVVHKAHTSVFIETSELVMSVVLFPCCGVFQCRQKLVSYKYLHRYRQSLTPGGFWGLPSAAMFPTGVYEISDKNVREEKTKTKTNKQKQTHLGFLLTRSRTIGPIGGRWPPVQCMALTTSKHIHKPTIF